MHAHLNLPYPWLLTESPDWYVRPEYVESIRGWYLEQGSDDPLPWIPIYDNWIGRSNRNLLDLREGRMSAAQEIFKHKPPISTPWPIKGRYYARKAKTWDTLGDPYQAAKAWTDLSVLYTSTSIQQRLNKQIWSNLISLPDHALKKGPAHDRRFNAWISLIHLYRQSTLEGKAWTQWTNEYSDHPAHESLSTVDFSTPKIQDPLIIALPWQGRHQMIAEALQAGILQAYYQQDLKLRPKMIWLDPEANTCSAWIKRLHTFNRHTILGPLSRDCIEKLPPSLKHTFVLWNQRTQPRDLQDIAMDLFPESWISDLLNHFAQQGWRRVGIVYTPTATHHAVVEMCEEQAIAHHLESVVHLAAQTDSPLPQQLQKWLTMLTETPRIRAVREMVKIPVKVLSHQQAPLDALIVLGPPDMVHSLPAYLRFLKWTQLPVVWIPIGWSLQEHYPNWWADAENEQVFVYVMPSDVPGSMAEIRQKATLSDLEVMRSAFEFVLLGFDSFEWSQKRTEYHRVGLLGVPSLTNWSHWDPIKQSWVRARWWRSAQQVKRLNS